MSSNDPRIAAIIELAIRLAQGDSSARMPSPQSDDDIDALGAALNMLGEELEKQSSLRQKAEGLLEDSVDLYENAPAMFASVDVNSRHILKCNDTLASVLGYHKEEIIGRSLRDFHAEQDWPLLRDILSQGKTTQHEVIMITKDGQQIEASLGGSFARSNSRWRAVWTDLRRRKQLESQLAQAQRLKAVGQLAGGVAHDFNNVLTAIMNMGYFVRQRLEGDAEGEEEVDEILAAAERASRLTSQLLAFSAQKAGKPSPVSVNDVVLGIDHMLRRTIGSTVELNTLLSEDIWATCVDESQLEQAILNIALNARDAMSDGGTLTISTTNEVMAGDLDDHRGRGEFIKLTMEDTGSGLSPKMQEHIFEPFFTTKEAGKGTGLGLAQVYGFVTRSKGSIEIASKPGQGARFEILLPRYVGSASSQPTPPRRAPPDVPAHGTVLVVEDQPAVRLAVVRVLKSRGYSVLEADNGESGLRAFQAASNVSLVLTDVVMPRMGGYEFVRKVLADTPDMPIIMMSGYNNEATEPRELAGHIRSIAKPFAPLDLLSLIEAALVA